mmetsp:Transcript_106279/g.328118  ORF Transcript_106279/g.328118 Transcript_106279/m.328118 type:complete len:282 (+) Transcript_106279:177-1022(+)
MLGLRQRLAQGRGQRPEGREEARAGRVLERSHEQRAEDLRRVWHHLALGWVVLRRGGQQPGYGSDNPLQGRATRQRMFGHQQLRLRLKIRQLRVILARLRVAPQQDIPNESQHRAHGPLVNCLVLLRKPGQRLQRGIKGLGQPLRGVEREQRQVPVPQGLRKHLVGRGIYGWRKHRPRAGCGGHKVPGNRCDEKTSQVHQNDIQLLVVRGGKETNNRADEAHVEGLRVLFATARHELHHGHKDWRGRCVLPCKAQYVTEGEADLLHELLILGMVDADPLYC